MNQIACPHLNCQLHRDGRSPQPQSAFAQFHMACARVSDDSPFNIGAIICSILAMVVSCSCLYHSFLERGTRSQPSALQDKNAAVVPPHREAQNNALTLEIKGGRGFLAKASVDKHSTSQRSGQQQKTPSAMRQLWRLRATVFSHNIDLHGRLINLYLRVLLQLSWLLFTVDSLCNLIHVLAVTWSCPQYNCVLVTIIQSTNCISGPMIQVEAYLQPMASVLFALATMNRFLTVYAVVSRERYKALRLGSLAIILTTAGNVTTFSAWLYFKHEPGTTQMRILTSHQVYATAYYVFWVSLATCEVSSLVAGLHHVLSVRAELDAVMASNQLGRLSGSSPQLAVVGDGQFATVQTNAETSLAQVQRRKLPTSPAEFKVFQERHKQTTRTVACLVVNLVLFLGFCAVMVLPSISESLPSTFLFTLLTLAVKIFGLSTTVAIHAMTDFVVSGSTSPRDDTTP